MRNTLILTDQIKETRPAAWTAITRSSKPRSSVRGHPARTRRGARVHPADALGFWDSMASTLIGGTAVGTVLILLFLPALYAAWSRVKPATTEKREASAEDLELPAMAADWDSLVGECYPGPPPAGTSSVVQMCELPRIKKIQATDSTSAPFGVICVRFPSWSDSPKRLIRSSEISRGTAGENK